MKTVLQNIWFLGRRIEEENQKMSYKKYKLERNPY